MPHAIDLDGAITAWEFTFVVDASLPPGTLTLDDGDPAPYSAKNLSAFAPGAPPVTIGEQDVIALQRAYTASVDGC